MTSTFRAYWAGHTRNVISRSWRRYSKNVSVCTDYYCKRLGRLLQAYSRRLTPRERVQLPDPQPLYCTNLKPSPLGLHTCSEQIVITSSHLAEAIVWAQVNQYSQVICMPWIGRVVADKIPSACVPDKLIAVGIGPIMQTWTCEALLRSFENSAIDHKWWYLPNRGVSRPQANFNKAVNWMLYRFEFRKDPEATATWPPHKKC